MRVSLVHARVGARRLAGAAIVLVLAACSGGDLLLPDDRTPVQLRAVSGDGQSALAGSPVPHPLVVEALDRAGRPVQGAVILFQFVNRPDGAAIAPPASETNPEGRAAVEVTLGTPVGEQPVDARVDDPERELRVRFLLTAIRSNNGGEDDDDPPDDDGSGPPDDGGGGGGGGDDGGNDDGGDGAGGNGGGEDDGGGGGGDGGRADDDGNGGGDDDGGDDDDRGDDDDDDEGNQKGEGRGGKDGDDDNSGPGNGDD